MLVRRQGVYGRNAATQPGFRLFDSHGELAATLEFRIAELVHGQSRSLLAGDEDDGCTSR